MRSEGLTLGDGVSYQRAHSDAADPVQPLRIALHASHNGVMAPTDALDRSLNNSVRVTGLVFLPAIVAINIGLLLDPDRRTEPTSGRFIYALGLPGWIVDGAMALFFTGWTVLIIVGWVRERRRRCAASDAEDHG